MTTSAVGEGIVTNRPLLAIALKVSSVLAFVGMGTVIRLTEGVPVGQILFFRSFFAIPPIIAYIMWRHELRASFHTKRPVAHVVRGIIGVVGLALSFVALVRLPLAEAITLGYATPLLSVLLGALILREAVGPYRFTAVIIGLAGVVVIAWPNLTIFFSGNTVTNDQFIGVVAALSGAAVAAFVVLIIRQMVKTERSTTIVLWFSITCTVCSLLSLPFGWIALSWLEVFILVLAGLLGGIGQTAMTECYRHGDIAVVAPFEYVSIVFGLAIGYWVFGDLASHQMLIGAAIVIATGIFVVLRERQLGLDREATHKVTPPH